MHDILTQESWTRAQLRDLVAAAVAPTGDANFDIEGPDVDLSPRIASALAMTLHELCTNAVKYGSLSQEGRVAVSWRVEACGVTPHLHLSWRESGGPPVERPRHRGFGTRLIERTLAADADGRVTLDFAPQGLRCDIDVPLGAEVLK